jgi:hypothetical protein
MKSPLNDWKQLWVTQLEVQNCWSASVIAASFNIIGMASAFFIVYVVPPLPTWPALVSTSVSLLLLFSLLAFRKNATVRFCSIMYLLNNLNAVWSMFVMQPYLAAQGTRWVPFQANKLSCLVAALLAPSFPVGILAISLMGGSALGQFYLFSPEVRGGLAIGEPFAMLGYAIIGALVLWHRMERVIAERNSVVSQAEAIAARKFTNALLGLRDLTNNPLQTIEFSIEFLRRKTPDQIPALDRVTKALRDLRRIDEVINVYESQLTWEVTDLSPEELPASDEFCQKR